MNISFQIDGYEEETSDEVKLALLSGTVKLFFERPPEVQSMLGRLLLAATSDATGESQDVRDRGLLYYRILRLDVNAAKLVISESKKGRQMSCFAEDQEIQIKDALFKEFDSLSIIYSKLQRHFIAPDKRPYDANNVSNKQQQATNNTANNNGSVVGSVGNSSNAVDGNNSTSLMGDESSASINDVSAAIYGSPVDLLGNDLLSMDFSSTSTPSTVSSSSSLPNNNSPATTYQPFTLNPTCEMSDTHFQELWQQWTGSTSEMTQQGLLLPGVSTQQVNADLCFKHLAKAHIFTMASGDLPDTVKLFL